jgi:hypothetical protein
MPFFRAGSEHEIVIGRGYEGVSSPATRAAVPRLASRPPVPFL